MKFIFSALACLSLLLVCSSGETVVVFQGSAAPASVHRSVDLSQDNALEAYSVATGTRVGRFPALVDEDESVWVPISSAGVAAAESGLAAALAEKAKNSEAAFQASKSAKLKGYENKVILFLRSEGVIATNAVSVTQDQLNAMYDAWDALPGNQGDAKASKYERLLRPVVRNGGTELGVRYH